MPQNILYFELISNMISFALMRADKYLAVKKKRRISEKVLILFTMLAPIGSLIAMIGKFVLGRHKNRKYYFWIAVISGIVIRIAFYL